MDRTAHDVVLIYGSHQGHYVGGSGMVQVARVEKSVDELLEKIAADNAELFELLATNGHNSRKK